MSSKGAHLVRCAPFGLGVLVGVLVAHRRRRYSPLVSPDSTEDYGQRLREQWRADRMRAAITPDTVDGGRFARLGAGSYLAFPQGVLDGVASVSIGADCVGNEFVTLSAGFPGVEPTSQDPVIRIGDRCVLGRDTEIIALESVVLEDDVWTAAGAVYITDHNHRYDQVDGTPIGRQWPMDIRPVRIGAGSVLSTKVTVLAGADIGHHTLVAAGAVVRSGSYPPHTVLAGVPARPVRSWDGTSWRRPGPAGQ